MAESFTSRLRKAWNVFFNRDPTYIHQDTGPGYYYRPDRMKLSSTAERTILDSILNRIAMDVAAIPIHHVRLDENKRYLEDIEDKLNYCLTVEANLDQTSRAFQQDAALTLLDQGCIAIVPVETTTNPYTGSYDIESMRVGTITQWYPQHVTVKVYNEWTGRKQEITLRKDVVAIVENPLYAVMNAPNSTLQRLIRKLRILDAIDEQSGSGKLDLIIQLPYSVRTDTQRERADKRRKDIEDQLAGSKYGIAYADATERITQLNRSVENNLMGQIEYLTSMLYSQLGITTTVMDGTADEQTMLNYNNRTIEPILSALVDSMYRRFLTKTARSQRQSLMFFRDPFRLVPVNSIAEIADKLTRNEILTSNEVRQILGMKPSKDPKADELRNKNLSQSNEEINGQNAPPETGDELNNEEVNPNDGGQV